MAQGIEATAGNINSRVAGLPAKSREQLLKVWDELFPVPPPPKLRKELMVPILAYRMQELEFGGLSHAARKRLQDLIAKNRLLRGKTAKAAAQPVHRAKLIRGWGGEVHEVLQMDSGYVYRGATYKTLSPIARKITGTQWSGPAFFGTKKKDRQL